MSAAKRSTSAPVRQRRWRVPPPLTRGAEMLEGAEILAEVPGETALLLWKTLRSLTLWASVAPQEQAELFAPEAHRRRTAELLAAVLEPALREPLEVLASVLEPRPEPRRDVLALACRRVAQWAAAQGAAATELAFMQAAALASPADAELAFEVGRLARAQGEHARAESWYRRAIMIGRQTGDWVAYARAYLGLGIVAKRRGNLPLARRSHLKALRSAQRHGLGEVKAMALHELFTVAVECDDASRALSYAEQAYHAYSVNHPYVRYLAHDLCCLWMREGQFQRALPVLRAMLPLFSEDERLLPWANVARAAGGAADREAFEEAWTQAVALLHERPVVGTTAEALLSLARGATGVGEWERAAEMAERALAEATAHSDAQVTFAAESALAFVRSRRAMEANVVRGASSPAEHQADRLAEEMANAFAGAAG
jgi:tetratricopeptide (TPR) repeat protein